MALDDPCVLPTVLARTAIGQKRCSEVSWSLIRPLQRGLGLRKLPCSWDCPIQVARSAIGSLAFDPRTASRRDCQEGSAIRPLPRPGSVITYGGAAIGASIVKS